MNANVLSFYKLLGSVHGAARQAAFAEALLSPPEFFSSELAQQDYLTIWADFLQSITAGLKNGIISADDAMRGISHLNFRYFFSSEESVDSTQQLKQAIVVFWLSEKGLMQQRSCVANQGICFVANSIGTDVESEMILPFMRAAATIERTVPKSLVVLNQQRSELLPQDCDDFRVVNLASLDIGRKLEFFRKAGYKLVIFSNDVTCRVSEQSLLASARVAPRQAIGQANCVSLQDPGTQGFFLGEMFSEVQGNEKFSESIINVPGVGVYLDSEVFEYSKGIRNLRDRSVITPKSVISGANFYKVSPRSLAVWSEILKADPECTLTLTPFNRSISDAVRERFVKFVYEAFSRKGIDAKRISILGHLGSRSAYLKLLSSYAYFVDSVPFSSGNCALDAKLVGVPVLCRQGVNFRGSLASAVNRMFSAASDSASSDEGLVSLAASRLKESPFGDEVNTTARERAEIDDYVDTPLLRKKLASALWRLYQS